ncbi:MAG: hypothetical protein ACRCXD_00070 [Luteolibacter sp.]
MNESRAEAVARLKAEIESIANNRELKVCVKISRTLRLPDDSFEKIEIFAEEMCSSFTREATLTSLQNDILARLDAHAQVRCRTPGAATPGPARGKMQSGVLETSDLAFED